MLIYCIFADAGGGGQKRFLGADRSSVGVVEAQPVIDAAKKSSAQMSGSRPRIKPDRLAFAAQP